MAIFGRRRSSMGRVRQQAAPVAATPLSRQRADVRAMAASTPKGSPVAPNSAAQAAALRQFNQSQQGAMQRTNSMAQFNQGQQAAMQRLNAQPKAPTMSPQAAQQMSAMGPKMPAMAKGGMAKKKTGYAKGGAVMCGASMPPAQKRKK